MIIGIMIDFDGDGNGLFLFHIECIEMGTSIETCDAELFRFHKGIVTIRRL